jgi:hypothetical protein
MQLDANGLAELIHALRSTPRPGEKRKHPRVGMRARAAVAVPPDFAEIPVWVRDLSAGGTNFVIDQEIIPGTRFQLLLGDRDMIACAVRFCRRSAPGTYSIGARFEGEVVQRAADSTECEQAVVNKMLSPIAQPEATPELMSWLKENAQSAPKK